MIRTYANSVLLALLPLLASAQQPKPMTQHATGSFDVKMKPLQADDSTGSPDISRFSLDKQFHGDLEASSLGLMLSAGDPNHGSAGYVAMERVTGSLHGRTGTFVLQHRGILSNGGSELLVTVSPGSSTGQLTGLAGKMTINIAAGKHSYEFEYTLP